ncbi:MAG: multiheme c-type cytochrome [Planctomycetaceae bacterium]
MKSNRSGQIETIAAQLRAIELRAAVLLLFIGCNASTPATTANSRELDTKQSTVCLIASGDTHGWIIPCGCTANQSGGLLRRGTYVAERRESAEVLVVDVGGAADGTAPYQRERFRAILKGEAQMGLVAHNVGAAELAFGMEALAELSNDTGVTFLSTNAGPVHGDSAAVSHVLTVQGGQTFLLAGVVSPRHTTDGVRISEPAAAILSLLDVVDTEYDQLVVLAYLPADELRQLAETLPEADVIIGGPTGQALSPETIGQTLLTSATNKGKFLAEVTFDPNTATPVGRVVEMSTDFPDHVLQTQNLTAFRRFLEDRDFAASESGFVEGGDLQSADSLKVAGTESCRDCHTETSDHLASTPHAHAWERLVSEGAHVDPYCQQCHTTGYGLPGGFVSRKLSEQRTNVGCESCHGPAVGGRRHSTSRLLAGRHPFIIRGYIQPVTLFC